MRCARRGSVSILKRINPDGNPMGFSTEEVGTLGGSMSGKVGKEGEQVLITGSPVSAGSYSIVATWTVTR